MTEINDVTSLTKSVNRIAKALNQDFSKESLTDSLDAIADYIEENGTGGSSEPTVFTITITNPVPSNTSIMHYETDVSYTVIKNAYLSGKNVMFKLEDGSENLNYIPSTGIFEQGVGTEYATYGVSIPDYSVSALICTDPNEHPFYDRT